MQELENQLFTTKVETETLKIDKKYFQDQINELQKKNTDMIANIENIMTTETKRITGSNLKTGKLSAVVVTETPAPKKDLDLSAKMPSSIRNLGGNASAETITPIAVDDAIGDAN